MSYNYDKEFLKQLDYFPNKSKYVRLIALDKDEKPVETIEGRATGGSINIDGASKKQRTCSGISLIGQDLTVNDINWAFKTKFKVEIGLENKINSNYPNIVWFRQGVYGINSFSIQQSINNITVNISGQDKMGYLDGTFGGILPMQINFGVQDYIQSDGNIITTPVPIYNIIKEAVHTYGGESYHNIIINDLDEYGYELWEYRGGSSNFEEVKKPSPIYYFYDENGKVENMTFYEHMKIYQVDDENKKLVEKELQQLGQNELYIQNTGFTTGEWFCLVNDYNKVPRYKIARLEYGDTAGYHRTELIYPGELILNAGDTVTSLLDKIVAVLGEFEYYYDLDGKFIFQKKKNYIQELLLPINNQGNYEPTIALNKYSYEFNDQILLTQMSRSPNIKDIKNDFVVWGSKKNTTGVEKPIHLRLAVAKKPTTYTSPLPYYESIVLYSLEIKENVTELPAGYSWYIFNSDEQAYVLANTEQIAAGQNLVYIIESNEYKEDFIYEKQINKYVKYSGVNLYKRNHITNKFETYTLSNTELISDELFKIKRREGTIYNSFNSKNQGNKCDWRELIYIMAQDYYQHNQELDFELSLEKYNSWCKNGKTGYEAFYEDLQAFWRDLYCPDWEDEKLWSGDYLTYGKYQGWNKKAVYSPSLLEFWFDFIEAYGDLVQYSIEEIGVRTKVENKHDISALFYETTPEVQFIINPTETTKWNLQADDMVYSPLWIQESIKELFVISNQGLSASEQLNNLIYKHLCCGETLNLTSIPVYYLEPNTRIYIKNTDININGDYLLTKVTIPLSYNGTMSLSVTKVIKHLDRVIFSNSEKHVAPNYLLKDINLLQLLENSEKKLMVERMK